jgi:D-apiose dehydrogenase
MARLRGVVIGCGFFSRIQMAEWNRLQEQVEITAACDTDGERARQFCADFGVPRSYASAEEALRQEKPDFVDIVTRPESHLPLVELAAAHKVHVLCQKPFAPTVEECRKVMNCVEAAGVRLMVNENWRWQGWYREIKRRIEAGEIGTVKNAVWLHSSADGIQEPLYPNQPYFRDYPRFLIYETLVHYLDCSRFLFGEPKRLRATIKRNNPAIRGEDEAHIRLEYAGGLRLWIHGTRCGEIMENHAVMGRMRIDGSLDTLALMGDGRLYRGTGTLEILPYAPPTGDFYRGDCAYATQRHFAEALASGGPFESEGRDYLRTVTLVEAAYDSARTRETISLA